MGLLGKNIPKIVSHELKNEDEITRILVSTLLHETFANQHKVSKQKIVFQALEDEIDKCITTGKINEQSIQGE